VFLHHERFIRLDFYTVKILLGRPTCLSCVRRFHSKKAAADIHAAKHPLRSNLGPIAFESDGHCLNLPEIAALRQPLSSPHIILTS
jgi:hypothetical protein